MDEYLFITLAKLRSDARRLEQHRAAEEASEEVRPQHQLDEAAAKASAASATRPQRASASASWFVPSPDRRTQS